MPTFLIMIEPAPVNAARFLARAASMPGSPFGVHPSVQRLQLAPHAYLLAFTPEDPETSIDEIEDTLTAALTAPEELSDTLDWQHQVYARVGERLPDPALTTLAVLNLDLRGMPVGLDRPFPAAPGWSRALSGEDGPDLPPLDDDALPDHVQDRLARAGEQDPWALDDRELPDLSAEELALFRPRIDDDHGWPNEPVLPY